MSELEVIGPTHKKEFGYGSYIMLCKKTLVVVVHVVRQLSRHYATFEWIKGAVV